MPVGEGDLAVDRRLAEISGNVPFLRLVTPINVTEARAAFLGGDEQEPEFVYRPLPDLAEASRQLDGVDPAAADDPAIRHMATALREELSVRLELLAARDTPRFFLGAVELFGHVDGDLHDLAMAILDGVIESPPSMTVSAGEFAHAAVEEIAMYRERHPEMGARVRVSDDVAGVMVENGDLYIGSDTRIAADHVEALVHHEVGVHVLTFANGAFQPLRMLATGLAGYDENQEALGVLAEHLAGGLRPKRLRTLGYRVVAAQCRSDQAGFRETYHRLVGLGANRRLAFTTTMRAFRAGGMTKDAIYLRGLMRLCRHLAGNGALESLFVGKIALADEPLVSELKERGVLAEPPLRPHFLDFPAARRRLDEIRAGGGVRLLGGIEA